MVRCFVTGGTGFIGRHVVERLVADGHEVAALVRPTSRVGHLRALGVDLVQGDMTDDSSWRPVVARAQRVYHAAAIVDLIDPKRERMLDVNVEGTRRILDACRQPGRRRLIHFSSVAALGDAAEGLADEQHELSPPYTSHYQESKHRSDLLVAQATDVDSVRIMPAVVIGYGDPKTGRLIRRFLQGRIKALPRTQGSASYVHVLDLVDGVELAARRGRPGHAYVFAQVSLTHEELVAAMAEITGLPPPRVRVPMPLLRGAARLEQAAARWRGRPARFSLQALRSLERRHVYSSQKARQELGWAPQEFKKRLRTTLEQYQADANARR